MPRQVPTTLRPRILRSNPRRKPPPRVPNRRPRFPTSTPPPGPSAHPSGFSIRSQQDSASFNPRLSGLPFVPPSPRSSIPESKDMIPQIRVLRLLEISRGKSAARNYLATQPRHLLQYVTNAEEPRGVSGRTSPAARQAQLVTPSPLISSARRGGARPRLHPHA